MLSHVDAVFVRCKTLSGRPLTVSVYHSHICLARKQYIKVKKKVVKFARRGAST